MKKTVPFIFFAVLFCALCLQPASGPAETLRFDADGLAISAEQYADAAAARQKALSKELADGYNDSFAEWKDPIETRQKRIEQWKAMRSQYNPQSLPHKIEGSQGEKQ